MLITKKEAQLIINQLVNEKCEFCKCWYYTHKSNCQYKKLKNKLLKFLEECK